MVRAHGDSHRLAWSLAEQGNIAFSLGLPDETGQLFSEKAWRSARRLDDTFLVGLGLFGLAYAAFLRGDLDTMTTASRGVARAHPSGHPALGHRLGAVQPRHRGDHAGATPAPRSGR